MIPVLKGLHGVVALAFKFAGYQWEVRRYGEVSIGLWRIRLRKKVARRGLKPTPSAGSVRRFVMVPGFGDTPLSWLPVFGLLAPFLRPKFDELILLDLPGFQGFLSDQKCFTSMDDLSSAIGDVLDDLKPHTLMGYSLGGWLAAIYAATCGAVDKRRAYSLGNLHSNASSPSAPPSGSINPSSQQSPAEIHSYPGPTRLILADPSGVFGGPEERKEWEAVFKSTQKNGFSPIRERLFAKEPLWFRWLGNEVGAFINREDTLIFMMSFRDDHSLEKRLKKITAETWLLWGEKDQLVPASWMNQWLQAFGDRALGDSPQVRGVYIRGVGHSPHVEAPVVTAGLLAQIVLGTKIPKLPRDVFWKLLN